MPYLTTVLRPDPQGKTKAFVAEDGVLMLPTGGTFSYAAYRSRFAKTARVEVRLAGLVLADLFAALNQREGPMRIEGRCEDGE